MKLLCIIGSLLLLATSGIFAKKSRASCAEVRRAFASERIGPLKVVPFYAIRTKNLNICSNDMPTCCTRRMEKRYEKASSKNLTETLGIKLTSITSVLKDFRKNFQDEFQNLMTKAEASLFSRLNSTLTASDQYTSLKRHVASVFSDHTLNASPQSREDIYKRFGKTVQEFVSVLYALTFAKQAQVTPDTVQLTCILNEVREISFHQSTVDFMLEKIQTSVNETVDLLHGVELGISSLGVQADSLINPHCRESLVRMKYCSHCYGLTLIKPCKGFCTNIMNGCLVGFSEVGHFWKYYVDALVSFVEKLIETRTDPWTTFASFTDHDDLFQKLKIEESKMQQIEETCLPPIHRQKRSAEALPKADELTRKLRKHRRRHHRRHQKIDLALDLESETDNSFESRRLIPPPHKMLMWEPSLGVKPPQKEDGTGEEDEQNLLELQAETIVTQPEGSGTSFRSTAQRFLQELAASKEFFDDFPQQACDLHQNVLFGITTFGSCWDGKAIVSNYTTPIVGKKLQNQLLNPEIKVRGLNSNVLKLVKNFQKAAKYLMLKENSNQLPDDLLLPIDDVMKTDKSKPLCTNDENLCDDETSGGGAGTPKTSIQKIGGMHKRNPSHKIRNKKRGRKWKRTKLKRKNEIFTELDIKLFLEKEKPFQSSPQGGARETQSKQKKKDPDNAASNIFNLSVIARTILVQFLIVWIMQKLHS